MSAGFENFLYVILCGGSVHKYLLLKIRFCISSTFLKVVSETGLGRTRGSFGSSAVGLFGFFVFFSVFFGVFGFFGFVGLFCFFFGFIQISLVQQLKKAYFLILCDFKFQ